MDDLKKKISEFASIAKECPENLQSICFEVLLKNHLDNLKDTGNQKENKVKDMEQEKKIDKTEDHKQDNTSKNQDDIKTTDLHVKAKKFMEKYSISIEDINQIFYKENDNFLPLFDELGSSKIAECQVRISLIEALVSAMKNGDFIAEIATVRQKSKDYKCYDGGNFSINYNNNKELFDFDKYDKNMDRVGLSESGKAKLSELIKALK
jgi:hypothetical protein